jgi:uncharacterized protein YndB with AHSA1/START domain
MTIKKNDQADREFRVTRLLNAPIDLVWEVWSNPDHIKNWWGPHGFTNTITKMDLRTNGEWKLTMHGPDGTDYPNESIFKEVIVGKKIVYEHLQPKFTSTIEFESRGDKTFLTWHMLFETVEEFTQLVKQYKADEGLLQNIEKLETYLQNHK